MGRIINILVFISILIIGCNKSNKTQTINEKIEDVSIHISTETQEQEEQYKNRLNQELIYDQIIENNCTITLFTKISEEIDISNETFIIEMYRIEIINNLHHAKIETEWLSSRPSPRMYWINEKIFRIDSGSVFAPSSLSYFYSKELHIISKDFYLATSFVDTNNELVLCAEFQFIVYKIFDPERYVILDTPQDSIGGLLWFSIGKNTYFENKNLFLEYSDENWAVKSKIYDLGKTGLY
jgi:hypothetical protein